MAGFPVPRAAVGIRGGVAVGAGEVVGEGVGVGVGVVCGWLDVDGSGAGTGAASLLQLVPKAATNAATASKPTSRTCTSTDQPEPPLR